MENSQNSTAPTFGSFSASKDVGNPFGSATKVFGNLPVSSSSSSSSPFGMPSSTQSQNVFSQSSSPMFGAVSKPVSLSSGTSVGLFGSVSGSATGLSTPSTSNFTSAPSAAGNVFGSVSAASSSGSMFKNSFASSPSGPPTLFGKPTSTNSTTTQSSLSTSPVPVFGSFGQKGEASSTSSSFGMFKGSAASQSTPSTNNPFAQSTSLSGTSTVPDGNVFGSVGGLAVAASSSSPFSTSPPSQSKPAVMFGKPQPQTSITSTVAPSAFSATTPSQSQPAVMFGKPQPSTSSSAFSATPTSTPQPTVMFGKPRPPTSSTFAVSSIPPFSTTTPSLSQSKPTAIFGKPRPPTSSTFAVSSTPPFSTTTPSLSQSKPAIMFGKPQPPPASVSPSSSSPFASAVGGTDKTTQPMLFGKPVSAASHSLQSSSSSSSTAGFTQSSSHFSTSQGQRGLSSSGRPTGLFGKPVELFTAAKSKVEDHGDDIEDGGGQDEEDYEEDGNFPKKSLGRWKSGRKAAALPVARRRSLLASSSRSAEDIAANNSLMVRNIPPDFCDKEILREHFSKYGNVRLIRVTPDKYSASITFDTKDSAVKAKGATVIAEDSPPMDIFYRQSPQSTIAKRSISKIISREPRKKSTVSQDAENELRSMAEIPEFETEPVAFTKVSSSKPQKPLPSVSATARRGSPTPPPPARRSSPPPPRRSSPTPHPAISVPQDSTSHAPPDHGTIKDLLKTLYQARAMETNERIAVLDKRDQLLKLLRGRGQADLSSAKAFKGTCPDMCPEKERYYREDTRRLALYEVIISTMSTVAGIKTKVDHSKAVKEYSRSSADQKEPFPHELRPLAVLQSTMVYLLTFVADEGGEGKWSEWYDFLWNRTRGIRKEITQQQLCHVDVAHLLERCARFHIFCSERLCEEDMMTFDAKINNENLTKCLQTLKELYSDLESKHGCYCPNEAEIRAYIVLMNLNQGDTLWEIQQLRPEIRDSPYIRFAVQAYNALNSSNYVRFFRLIKQTTFLNSSILHRYFNQIRTKALDIIKKAMATQGKSVSYPVSEMIRLMCFENTSEVGYFCSHYGLRVVDSSILLDNSPLFEPEGSLPERRSVSLVESKRAGSVGETIYGGPLPPLDFPPPSSSFDSNGRFVFSPEFQQALVTSGLNIPSQVGEVFSRSAGSSSALPAPSTAAPTIPAAGGAHSSGGGGGSGTAVSMAESQKLPSAREVSRLSYSTEAIKVAARTLILEETDGQVVSVVREVLEEEEARLVCGDSVAMEIIDTTVKENIRCLCADVIEEEEQELRNALEVASRKNQCIERLCQDFMEEVIGAMVKDVTREEWRLVEEKRHRQALDCCVQMNVDAILERVVGEGVEEVAADVFQVEVVAKRERLADTEARILHRKMAVWFQHWHRAYLRRMRVKRATRAMLDFPVAAPTRSHTSQLSALIPSRPTNQITGNSFYVGDKAKLNVTSPMNRLYSSLHLSASLSMASAQQMLSGLRVWQPLDISTTLARPLIRLLQEWKDCSLIDRDTKYLQWKLVLSTPAAATPASEFVRWVKAKLGWEMPEDGLDQKPVTTTEGEVISNYTTTLNVPNHHPVSLSVCVRGFHGNWKDEQATAAATTGVLKGMNGLVFVTADAQSLMDSEAVCKKDSRRLHDLLTRKAKHPSIPLVLIIPRLNPDLSVTSDLLNDRLQLASLHKRGLLSAVHMAQPCVALQEFGLEIGSEWGIQFSNCLGFLAGRLPPPPPLAVKTFPDFVEDGVVEYYKATVYPDLRTRTRHQMVHQSPNTLLTLYNDVIDHLARVVASDTLTKSSWPAPEFDKHSFGLKSDWNSEANLCGVFELMTKMRLPPFRYSNMELDDWDTACRDVWAYVESVTRKDSGSAKICLYQKVVDLLHTSKKRFDQFVWLASEDGDCEPTYINMVWTDLIDACIHYKMVSLRTGHVCLSKPDDNKEDEGESDDEDDLEEVTVYFDQSELEDYEAPSAWLDALRDTETIASLRIKETMVKKTGVKRHRDDWETHNETVRKRNRSQMDSPADNDKSMMSTQKTDPVLKSLSDSYLEMLDSEKEASERYDKLLASVLDPSNLNFPIQVSTPFYHPLQENDRPKEITPISTPNSKHTNKVQPRPDLKRRKLSDILLKAEEISSPSANLNLSLNKSDDKNVWPKLGERSVVDLDPGNGGDTTMTKKLLDLKEEMERQKQLDTLYEMKLKKWMTDGDCNL